MQNDKDKIGTTISQLNIQTPCPENWENMHGEGAVRFCDICEKNVHQLDALPEKEQQQLVAKLDQGESLCVRIKKPVARFQNGLLNLRLSAPLAASVLMCMLLSSCSEAVGSGKEPCPITPTTGQEHLMGKPAPAVENYVTGAPPIATPQKQPPKQDPGYFMGNVAEPPTTPPEKKPDVQNDDNYLQGEVEPVDVSTKKDTH